VFGRRKLIEFIIISRRVRLDNHAVV